MKAEISSDAWGATQQAALLSSALQCAADGTWPGVRGMERVPRRQLVGRHAGGVRHLQGAVYVRGVGLQKTLAAEGSYWQE